MSREYAGARSVAGQQQDATHTPSGPDLDPALTGPTGLSARLQAADIRANGGAAGPAPAVQRQEAGAPPADGSMCAPEQVAPPERGINKAGFIDHSDGSNIRTGPAESGGQALTSTPLPPATRVFVTGTHPDAGDWWYVSAHAPEGIVLGYVQHFRVNTDLPEPGAKLYAIQSGDTAEKIAAGAFSDAVRPGHDLRFYENVLLSVNQQAGRDGIHGTHQDPNILGGGSDNIQLTAGKRIWLVSPGYARTLEGIVPDGSLTNGAYGQAKEALAHIQDILASVTMAPDVAAEVAGQYLEVIQAHLTEIIAVVSLFIAAEAAASLLAASPTGAGQIAAVVIQLILAAVAGYSAVQAAGQALTEGSQWLTLAWSAQGDPAQIAEASKAFVRMLVQIALAALAALGAQASVGKAGQIAGKLDIQLPQIAMAMTPEGVMVPQYIPGQVGTSGATAIDAGIGAGPQVGTSMAMSGKGRGTARSQHTNADARAAAEANGYRAVGKTRSGETIFHKKGGDPPYLVRSRTGHRGEMFKGFASQSKAIAGRTSKSARLGSYDHNLNRIAD